MHVRMRVLGRLIRTHQVLIWLWVFLSAVAAISYLTEGVVHFLVHIDTDTIRSVVAPFGNYAALIFVVLNALEVIIAPLHPSVLYIASGLLFGGLWGGVLILIGNMIGSLIAFFIARKVGRPIVERLPEEKTDKFDAFSKRYGPLTLFVLRVNPFTNSDALNYVAGASSMSTRGFIVSTLLGHAPGAFLASYLAAEVVRDSPFFTLLFLWFSLLYMVFFVYVVIYNHRKVKKRQGRLKKRR